MSEITRGVIGMPYEMAMGTEISRRQFHAIARELFAENESLRGSCKAMGSDMGKLTRERNSSMAKAERLKAECEGLRADAERYRWIENPFAGLFGVTSLDKYIDAAMSKGEQS